jgi:anti-anti-sigma regulatory factor
LASLSLENAGVRHDSRGIVCDRTLRTSVPHIYACGDIVGPYQLASTAEAQAILAATNAFLPFKRKIDYRNSVFLIFTEPPLAYVGLTEEQAREKFGRKMQVYRFEYSNMRRALIDGNDVGMAKLICDGRGKIAGAHLLGDAAGEVIHEFVAMKTWKKPLHRLNAVTHAYPTYAQALAGRAGQLAFLDRMGRNVFVRLALGLLPGFANRLNLARDRLAETHPAGFSSRGGKADRAAGSLGEPPAEIGFSAWRKGEKTGDIGVRHFDGKTLILDMRTVLNAAWEQDLSLAFGEALTTSKNVLLNFSGLLHIDPEGAGLLIVNIFRAARERLDVGACGLSDAFRAVFRLTRLDELIAIFGDEQEALSASTFRKRHFPSSFSPIGPGPIVPGWANPVERLSIIDIPAEAMNINVHGRKTSSPVRGFGRLWDKKYRLRIPGTKIEPVEAISVWKAEFPHFWPEGNRIFYSGSASLAPGTVALLNLKLPGGLVMATGFMVMYADETSFSFLAAQGHVISGWITFRIFRENTAVIVQVHPLFRTSDPSFELGFRLGAAKEEDRFWHGTLRNFAGRLGVQGETEQEEILADPRVQWREFRNLWQNAAIRSVFYMPFYALKRFPGPRENRFGGS